MKKTDKPSTHKVSAMRQWLRDHGMPAADANALIRAALTLGEIADGLRAHLRARPRQQTPGIVARNEGKK